MRCRYGSSATDAFGARQPVEPSPHLDTGKKAVARLLGVALLLLMAFVIVIIVLEAGHALGLWHQPHWALQFQDAY